MNRLIQDLTDEINKRSAGLRKDYLERVERARFKGPHRGALHCGNLAHGFAACALADKDGMKAGTKPDIAIISAYNDLLSAHQPYQSYPEIIKAAISKAGGIAQFAAGVPAMCDGITQGQPGMDLSLMSRDIIAMSAAIGLSHNLFDGGLMLGICDKIVPGLLMAALSFGHLPFVFIPAGPMPSGISNQEKAEIRQLYAEGKIDKKALLEAESASYHSPGTCTFYGTANSNQLLMEVMGLHLPGASFVNPNTPLRDALTQAAAQQVLAWTELGENYLPIAQLFDAKTLVNGMVALLATGGSTNHTIHLIAIARMAGFLIDWDDFSRLSTVTPLLTRIYPNGYADINDFQRAGGMACLISNLLEAGLLHADVHTVAGFGLERYTQEPVLEGGRLLWKDGLKTSSNPRVLTSASQPFKPEGGLKLLKGNLGRAVLKTSALKEGLHRVCAPAVVFDSQEAFTKAFKAGELDRDCIVVLRYQGPNACGMPELHQLTPALSVLQDKGFKVGLLTDGRMSGASGKVLAAIHLTPEALSGGMIAKIKTGDPLVLDGDSQQIEVLLSEEELSSRTIETRDLSAYHVGMGRELFGTMRRKLSGAEQGACSLFEG